MRRARALSISIYAQARKQPRICRREIDSPQKQADSLERVERFPLPLLRPLFHSLSRAREKGALSRACERFKSS